MYNINSEIIFSFYHFLVRVGILCVVFNHCINYVYQLVLFYKTSNFFYKFYDVLTVPERIFRLPISSFYIFLLHFRDHAYEFFY